MKQDEHTTREQHIEKIVTFVATAQRKELETFLQMGKDIINSELGSKEKASHPR